MAGLNRDMRFDYNTAKGKGNNDGIQSAIGIRADIDPDAVPLNIDQRMLGKWDHVEMMRTSLKESKNILSEIDEDGLLYAQLWEIYRIFCAK